MVYSNNEKAILKTIVYSDIFNFPLSKKELWNFLIDNSTIDEPSFERALRSLSRHTIIEKDGLYCLNNKEQIIRKRKNSLKELKKKLWLANKAAYYISHIPTIYFIGVSGGVAVGNVDSKDDVDLFIITQKKTLFTTRLLILAILEVFNMRRKRGDNRDSSANKMCVNLLIDETSLYWQKNKQDIYTAHEIARMKPLFERNRMYKRFLDANQWIHTFFPNYKSPIIQNEWKVNYHTLHFFVHIFTLPLCESIIKRLQKIFIARNLTNETISNTMLAFHPRDYRREILSLVRKKFETFHLLTNV